MNKLKDEEIDRIVKYIHSMKAIEIEYGVYKCPRCWQRLVNPSNFCHICGQKVEKEKNW